MAKSCDFYLLIVLKLNKLFNEFDSKTYMMKRQILPLGHI